MTKVYIITVTSWNDLEYEDYFWEGDVFAGVRYTLDDVYGFINQRAIDLLENGHMVRKTIYDKPQMQNHENKYICNANAYNIGTIEFDDHGTTTERISFYEIDI